MHELSYYGVFTGIGYILIADSECSARFCFVYAVFDVRLGVLWLSVLWCPLKQVMLLSLSRGFPAPLV